MFTKLVTIVSSIAPNSETGSTNVVPLSIIAKRETFVRVTVEWEILPRNPTTVAAAMAQPPLLASTDTMAAVAMILTIVALSVLEISKTPMLRDEDPMSAPPISHENLRSFYHWKG